MLQALNYTVTSTYQGLGRGRSYLGELSRSKFLPFIHSMFGNYHGHLGHLHGQEKSKVLSKTAILVVSMIFTSDFHK